MRLMRIVSIASSCALACSGTTVVNVPPEPTAQPPDKFNPLIVDDFRLIPESLVSRDGFVKYGIALRVNKPVKSIFVQAVPSVLLGEVGSFHWATGDWVEGEIRLDDFFLLLKPTVEYDVFVVVQPVDGITEEEAAWLEFKFMKPPPP